MAAMADGRKDSATSASKNNATEIADRLRSQMNPR